ncbi:MAG: alpha/beta fold hydrolase [Novosphingobium sp.]|jgi:polyhydroxyalkanoate synthase|nr:alpha/beta fold hydrolase [Novosphingobium sp.]
MENHSQRDETSGRGNTGWAALPNALFGLDGPFAGYLRATNPFTLFQQNMALCRNLFEIALGSSQITPEARDWRFQDEAWTRNPFYRRLSQAYLAMTDAVEQMIPEGLSQEDNARARLAADIVTSAFAPTNTLLGNPAATLRAIETRGDSVTKGFRNFVDDWLNNEGMPSQVDDSKFQVGKNLGVTPGKVVHKTEMFELIQYQPSCETVHEIPTLLIPPQIGRFYFTDLAPGRSFAEYAVSRGLNHFVVSWRNPQAENREWGLEDYIRSALEAVETVAAIAGQPKINLISFCAGGILSSIVAGYLASKGRGDMINSLALCVTMLNWKVDASIGAFRFPAALSVAKAQSEMKGVLGGNDLHKVFTWLRPNDLVWNYWVNNYLMGETPAAFDILAWNKDSTNLPAQLHKDFLRIFEENLLVHPGQFEAMGEKIDLGQITCDNFIVGAVTDHLTPWKACYQSCLYLGGDSTFALSNGGHVAALVNPPTNPKAHHWIAPGTAPDADAWMETATRNKGSWWEGWADWVSARSGKRVPAPAKLGSRKFPPRSSAPGEYVTQ